MSRTMTEEPEPIGRLKVVDEDELNDDPLAELEPDELTDEQLADPTQLSDEGRDELARLWGEPRSEVDRIISHAEPSKGKRTKWRDALKDQE